MIARIPDTMSTSCQRGRRMNPKLSRAVTSGMMRPMPRATFMFVACAVLAFAPAALARPAKKYHFELTKVTVKDKVKPDVGKVAQPRVEAAVEKAFKTNPQLVPTLDGAPDPKHADAYRAYLRRKGIAGAYKVTVEITDASYDVAPEDDRPHTQRITVHVALHVLGETIPGQTMGFTGDGQATVKQEVGMKIRDADRNYTWDSAAEVAVDDALKTCFAKLALPHAHPLQGR